MSDLLKSSLETAVPLWIEKLKEKGGPTSEDFSGLSSISDILGSRGDILLFGNGKKGEAAEQFNMVAKSIAILSFVPGGITLFETHWETNK